MLQGLSFFFQKAWLPALACWIPCFERSLRERLTGLGVRVYSHETKPGIERGLLLDSLIEEAKAHFDERTTLFWKHWFSHVDGVGNNIRNEHCHGYLEAEQYCDWLALGTLLAFLFLLAPRTQDQGSESET